MNRIIRGLVCGFSTTSVFIEGFHSIIAKPTRQTKYYSTSSDNEDSSANNNPMSSTSFLSHVMLKVPDVDRTVAYWTEKGGRITSSRPKDENDGEEKLRSAFVELGCFDSRRKSSSTASDEDDNDDSKKDNPACFSLELVAADESTYELGNEISYLGVSMLLQFQMDNIVGAITGDEPPKAQGDEPNGIQVTSAASAPGDFFARLALKSNDLESTLNFYQSVLGMDCKAQDADMICLRFENDCFKGGVPTTLVFDKTTEEIKRGECYDHMAIITDYEISDLYESLQGSRHNIYMKPTEMFGRQVMGLIDPNGYKVVIASK